MSYEIVYEKLFIKTSSGGITPVLLAGSNNCYEPRWNGKERRSRSWFVYNNKLFDIPAAEMLKIFEGYISPYDQHFKMHGKWVTNEGLMRFAKNGIKNARSVEEICSAIKGPLSCYISVWGTPDLNNHRELAMTVATTAEYELFAEKVKERILNQKNEEIHIIVDPQTEKIPIYREIAGKVSIKCKYGYLSEVETNPRGNCFTFNKDPKEAMVFNSFSEAEEVLSLRRYERSFYRIVKTDSILKEKPYIIRCSANSAYVESITKKHLYYTRNTNNAKKFPTENAATRYIKEKLLKFRNENDFHTEYVG